MFMMTELLHS